MSKPEWGNKHICQNCGARFYDMKRQPAVCPKCDKVVEPEPVSKSRRPAAPPPEPKAVPVAVAANDDLGGEDIEAIEGEGDDVADAAEEEGELIEDTSDLGEDDDDMAEVMENIDENPDE